jgi:hypothetical protein
MNSKLHAVTNAAGHLLQMFLMAGQWSDYIGARALLDERTPAEQVLANRGYDVHWLLIFIKTSARKLLSTVDKLCEYTLDHSLRICAALERQSGRTARKL